MTDDTALKIAALVNELGRTMVGTTSVPTEAQMRLMAGACSSTNAAEAIALALITFIQCTPDALEMRKGLLDTVLSAASGLAAMHVHNNDRTRFATRGEILRMLASASDREDDIKARINDGLDVLQRTARGSNTGAN